MVNLKILILLHLILSDCKVVFGAIITRDGLVVLDGDMVMTPKAATDLLFRAGRADRKYLWQNSQVLYTFDKDFTVSQIHTLRAVMDDIERHTCIIFRELKSDEGTGQNHALIKTDEDGCWSFVGYQQIQQQLTNFNSKCFKKPGTIYHELLHLIGLFHMQSSNDRDDFVKVVWDNVKDGMAQNFEKYDLATSSNYDIPYDYGSVMHYSQKAFSKNKNYTIVPLQETTKKIGQRDGPSNDDYRRINNMYGCKKEINNKLANQIETATSVSETIEKTTDEASDTDLEIYNSVSSPLAKSSEFHTSVNRKKFLKGFPKMAQKLHDLIISPAEKLYKKSSI
ncbi:hypothetical protein DMENIID0001_128040 [Sergentomyia squamirostris]